MNAYFQSAMMVFLTILLFIKYEDQDKLRESIEEYIAEITPHEVIEGEDIFELEEIADEYYNFVIENKEIFYNDNI
tara:strand:+ start:454 stop:681 length:228 start_codon:yes stop_codon:yes gene_type:complete